jgi:hypothetical protein
MVAYPAAALSAARAGRHAPRGPVGLALPDDPGVGKPVVRSAPTLLVGRRRQPAAISHGPPLNTRQELRAELAHSVRPAWQLTTVRTVRAPNSR